MPETPKKIRGDVDAILHRLNAEWDLQLPRLHGKSADAAEGTSALARRCSARIRYLCFRLGNLDRILEDFDKKAVTTRSKWVSKPRQEKDTLPSFPITKSNLRREVVRTRTLGLLRLSEKERQHLLTLLDVALEDDYELARASDSYSVTPAQIKSEEEVSDARISLNSTTRRKTAENEQADSLHSDEAHESRARVTSQKHAPVYSPAGVRSSISDLGHSGRALLEEEGTPFPWQKNPSNSKLTPGEGTSLRSGRSYTQNQFWEPQHLDLQRPTTKRKSSSKDSVQNEGDRRSKAVRGHSRQASVKDFFKPPPPPPSRRSLTATITHPVITSFDSAHSSSPSKIFETENGQASSADTSVLDQDNNESQDFFPTQEAAEYLKDESIIQSLNASTSTASGTPKTFRQRLDAVLDFPAHRLPSNLSFEVLYEIQSLSLSWKMDALGVFKGLERRCGRRIIDSNTRWQAVKLMARERGSHHLQHPAAWSPNADGLPSNLQRKATYLSGTLHWAGSADENLLRLQLNGPNIDKSCRFHRYYGSTRFLVLNVPYTQKSSIPSHLKRRPDDHKEIHSAVLDWLSTGHLSVAGRVYRAFWMEPSDKRDDYFCRVHLFAVSGVGLDLLSSHTCLRPISIEKFMEWHTPIEANKDSTDLKLFARYKLGLSKTIPTVVLDQDEIIQVNDKKGTDGKIVMNDGCSKLSKPLADEISALLGLPETPSAFQGRLSGAKGLWIVDWKEQRQHQGRRGFWIEVSESQLKIKPHPAHRKVCDTLRTFEVSDYSRSTPPASLNTQLITVLSDRGVPRSVLETKLQDFTTAYYAKLSKSIDSADQLRGWLQEYHSHPKGEEIAFEGAVPSDKSEKLNMLLDSGFKPRTCAQLHEWFRERMHDYLNWYVEKCRITVPQSTYVFCIPDPYDILEPGEVHLGFSVPWQGQTETQSKWYLADCEGLVARNPANLPSDVQKIKFVHHPMLEKYKDVVIFSSKGKRPLASLLSGGDYDGDEVFVCWDADIVDKFTNYAPGPPDQLTPEDCGLTLRSRELSHVFPEGRINRGALANFLAYCLKFNMTPSLLGRCTNEHQKWVYKKSLGRQSFQALQDRGAILLAALAGYLVDAPKQGYELSERSWIQVRNDADVATDLEVPAFKKSESEVGNEYNKSNVNDFLRFRVARPEKERILTAWGSFRPHVGAREELFTQLFSEFRRIARQQKQAGDETLSRILDQLKSDIDAVVGTWTTSGAKKDDQSFRQRVAYVYDQFTSIQPLPSATTHPICNVFLIAPGSWENLRASCYYSHNYNKNSLLMWLMIGDTLCDMKARSLGQTRTMTASMYTNTKVDTKALKRQLEGFETDPDQHVPRAQAATPKSS